jgi:hypothetical protein
MLISDYVKKHIPLVLSLAGIAAGAYLAWQFRERIPALWTKTKKLDKNES